MAKLRNLRAYVPGTNASTVGDYASYDTASNESGNAILRKINLNVDIATQNELNEAFTTLSNAITATGTEWKEADEALSTALKEWAKGDELSGALHTEVTDEATARAEADQAIRDSLSAYALSTTVADAYKVAVSEPTTETSSYVYTVTQGGESVGTIEVAKDIFVESAYFDGTILVLDLRNGDTISTDLSGFVDVYEGSDDSEVVTTVEDNVISVRLTEEIARVGADTDLSSADTVYGAKAFAKDYADAVSSAVAVEAEGDAIVSADANGKKVTVGATTKLSSAVALAETAVQTVAGDDDLLTATRTDNDVEVAATDRLANVVTAVETSADGWNAAEGNAKDYTNTVSSLLSTSFHNEITAEAEARANADQALSNAIDALSVSLNAASGDAYVSAFVDGNEVKVQTQDRTKQAIDKVEAASATWDAALQGVAMDHGTFVTTGVTEKADNSQTLSVGVTTHDVADAVEGTSDGLAVASDVKDYVDGKITDLSVAATGDAYVSADSTGKAITVGATDQVKAVVAKVQAASADWDSAEADAIAAAKTYTDTVSAAIDTRARVTALEGLSSTITGAANTLDSETALTVKDLTAYNDIDDIIEELEALKAAVKAFAGTVKAG